MDPHATQDGLTSADSGRARTSASGVPLPPAADQYTAAFFTTATALLGTAAADVVSRTVAGQSATAATIPAVEATEEANADMLKQ
ncbi:hypothetical protein EB74_10250 [Mycobacterium sp. SWH-M5]|nr:hypothetical protein EB74_10250 [Mycobacterium sp. SWH-M5]